METFCQDSAWYSGLTLAERVRALRGHKFDGASDGRIAARRLQRWKAQPPFSRQSDFAARLAEDDLTEEEFGKLLGVSAESLLQTMRPPPGWLCELDRAWSDGVVQDGSVLSSAEGLLTVARPLLAWGTRRIVDGIAELQRQYAGLPFVPDSVIGGLFKNLGFPLGPMLGRAMVLELNAARLRGQLHGDTGEVRFQSFLENLSDKNVSLAILREYPVLARQLLVSVDFSARYALEFLSHLCRDWPEIVARFPGAAAAGPMVSFTTGAGDTHNQGRSVIVAKFQSGFQLIYKPHSLSVDIHYQELLDWCNRRNFESPFRTLRILDRGSHGWSEFALDAPCESASALERFYFRIGGQMALLYVCNAGDFHYENVLACGEHPVLVDLETLFHPTLPVPASLRAGRFTQQLMEDSVLRTHLLPRQVWLNEELEGVDVSGLSAGEGQTLPFLVARPQAAGTDEMRFVRQKSELPVSRNRPRLSDCAEAVNPRDYTEQIVSGFASIYRILDCHRAELLSDSGPIANFAADQVRVVLRPTHTYGWILNESFHPSLLRDALDRARLIDRLWDGIEWQPRFRRAIPWERRDLERGDIPCFTTRPRERHLYASDGECLEDFFDEPAMNVVRRRLETMREAKLEKQIALIRCSMATLDAAPSMPAHRLPAAPASSGTLRERLMKTARRIADRLVDLAWTSDAGDLASWVGLISLGEKTWSVMPSDPELYNGLSGPALFLGCMGAITGQGRYTDMARSALNLAWLQSTELRATVPDAKVSLGAFSGDCGLIHVLGRLGHLWSDPELVRRAEELTGLLTPTIAEDESFDIISGAAGCICVMDTLHAATGSQIALDVARTCGDHLVDKASLQQSGAAWKSRIQAPYPLTGFSHGAAGIAYALLRLFHRTGDDRYRQTALAAIEYERSQFLSSENNWRDWRVLPGDTPDTPPRAFVAWCHGAPGIGLSRVAALPWHEDAFTRNEIEIALRTTVAKGFGNAHALCHGDLGNLEFLLVSARHSSSEFSQGHLERLTSEILDSIERNGWLCSTPACIETAGFMLGLSGIGYELLRLAYPDQVPSILLLEGMRS